MLAYICTAGVINMTHSVPINNYQEFVLDFFKYFLLTKFDIQEEAKNYENLPPLGKTKNRLVLFGLLNIAATFLISDYSIFGVYGSLLYLFLLAFIYSNHRWAIIFIFMIFVAEKLFMSFLGIRPTGQILIGTIFAFYAYNALRVAAELKKNK